MKLVERFFYLSIVFAIVILSLNLSNHREYQIVINSDDFSSYAILKDGEKNIVKLPFSIKLDSLNIENYSSGMLKMQSAQIELLYENQTLTISISVNKPYFFYQYGLYLSEISYKQAYNQKVPIVELSVTEENFRLPVLICLYLIVALSVLLFIRSLLNYVTGKNILIVVFSSFVVCCIVLLGNPIMRTFQVPPILRSVWFLPHVTAYIISYAFFLFAFVVAIFAVVKRDIYLPKSIALFECGTYLYALGLVLGMIWAHYAWGTFWGWDIKETLALVAWLAQIIIVLIQQVMKQQNKWLNLFLQFVALLLLLLCWFGPNLFNLGGLHAYN